jgi:hypothetical protein
LGGLPDNVAGKCAAMGTLMIAAFIQSDSTWYIPAPSPTFQKAQLDCCPGAISLNTIFIFQARPRTRLLPGCNNPFLRHNLPECDRMDSGGWGISPFWRCVIRIVWG